LDCQVWEISVMSVRLAISVVGEARCVKLYRMGISS